MWTHSMHVVYLNIIIIIIFANSQKTYQLMPTLCTTETTICTMNKQ